MVEGITFGLPWLQGKIQSDMTWLQAEKCEKMKRLVAGRTEYKICIVTAEQCELF